MVNVNYRYVCACKKDPLRGNLKTDDKAAKIVFDILDQAWAQSHSRSGCTSAAQARTVTPRNKKADK